MDHLLSRLPEPSDIRRWAHAHRGKIAGLFAGTVGLLVFTTFLVVAITGVPYGGSATDFDAPVVYPFPE